MWTFDTADNLMSYLERRYSTNYELSAEFVDFLVCSHPVGANCCCSFTVLSRRPVSQLVSLRYTTLLVRTRRRYTTHAVSACVIFIPTGDAQQFHLEQAE